MDYNKQTINFLKKTKTTIEKKWVKYDKHFTDDKRPRHIWHIIIRRNEKSFSFTFGASFVSTNKTPPDDYAILSCLQKYDVGNFKNFCDSFGYDIDSRNAEKTYKTICKEYSGVVRVFGDVLEELSEIV